METDEHLEELMRQCAEHTPLARLSNVERRVVFRWLIDNGHMTRTGKPLERPRPAPHPIASNPHDGSPIYARNADHSRHETVTMQAGRAG